ncbi:hypothetical protein ASPZODRAFT_19326 [Penicilliopsis zonata CBS 506.65]|uniref:BZIP domain-containing protein n=1 Tax=Penicilliopsis zonata CBS 506.65 TaxID=1073090 RepID=A0A1L9S8Y5_9EURO|nr:hypothetical protein ASPZODRAFT_19326 [Penicilliopsis zonata CBS 506.65]OJJ43604.1 hypothetical protein ASPZODRAFT_19326 [Penicilliopsis zonata CBS 506.65]
MPFNYPHTMTDPFFYPDLNGVFPTVSSPVSDIDMPYHLSTAAPFSDAAFGAWSMPDSDEKKRKTLPDTTAEQQEKRRAQNRAAQRAFRERQKRHTQILEDQVSQLNQKHILLLQSYAKRSDEMNHLHDRIVQLQLEIEQLRAAAHNESSSPSSTASSPSSTDSPCSSRHPSRASIKDNSGGHL